MLLVSGALCATAMVCHAAVSAADIWTQDSTFQPVIEGGSSGGAGAIALPDGSVLADTNSTIVNGRHVTGSTLHFLADGTLDPSFSIPNGTTVAGVYPDGRLLAFRDSDGYMPRPVLLYRLRANGAIDPDFLTVSIVGESYHRVRVNSDGTILLSGYFDSVNAHTTPCIARLHANGSLDSTLVSPFPSNNHPLINDAVSQSDGKIVLVGRIPVGNSWQQIARLNADGSVDSTFAANKLDSSDSYGDNVLILPNGQIMATAGGTVARLNADGTADSTYAPVKPLIPLGSAALAASGQVYYLELSIYDQVLHRLKADGTIDPGFTLSGPYSSPYAVTLPATWDETHFYFGAALTSDRGVAGEILSEVDAQGKIVTAFAPRFSNDAAINVIGRSSDGSYLIFGNVGSVNGTKVPTGSNSIFRLTTAGALDLNYTNVTGVSPQAVQPDGQLFATAPVSGGVALERFSATGSLVSTVTLPKGANPIATDSVGHVYVWLSDFTFTRYNADGTLDSTFATVAYNGFNQVVPTTDNRLYVSPNTGLYNPVSVIRLTATGAVDPTFAKVTIAGSTSCYFFAFPDGGLGVIQELPYDPYSSYLRIARYDTTGKPSYACNVTKDALSIAGVVYDQVQAIGTAGEIFLKASDVLRVQSWPQLPAWIDVRSDGQLSITGDVPSYPSGSLVRYTRNSSSGPSAAVAPSIFGQPTVTAWVNISGSSTTSTVNIVVTPLGEEPFTYQWLFNGTPLVRTGTSANLSSLELDNFQATDVGTYSVVISNKWGSVTSTAGRVDLPGVPAIQQQPDSQTVRLGTQAKLSVAAMQSPAPTYQWQTKGVGEGAWTDLSNDSVYTNTTWDTLTINAADPALNGRQYRCVLTYPSGPLTSDAATLTVKAATDYSGSYFGSFVENSGRWALRINTGGTGTFIASLPDRGAILLVTIRVDDTGTISATGRQMFPPSVAATVRAEAVASGSAALQDALVSTGISTVGYIGNDGSVVGPLQGFGATITGAIDATTPTGAVAGYYSASALGTSSSSLYAIVAPSGQALVLSVSGSTVDYATATVDASGHITGTSVSGATLALTLSSDGQTLTGTVTPLGSSVPLAYDGVSDQIVPAKHLVNLSTRALGSTGDNVTIGGFGIAGSGQKKFLIRAVGPTLTFQGILPAEVMLDPTIELHDALNNNAIVATNDNWGDNADPAAVTAASAQVGAAAFTSADTKSSALLVPLSPGVYSFVVQGKASTSGVVLLEVYDAETSNTSSSLVNISARARATTGSGVTIGGFAVSGNAPKKLLVRAVGPTLVPQGIPAVAVLQDPVIEVHDALHDNAIVATNDNWTDNTNSSDITVTGARVGATPFLSTDQTSSALLLTLQPGVYTFVASGKNGTSGIVLIEVYDAD